MGIAVSGEVLRGGCDEVLFEAELDGANVGGDFEGVVSEGTNADYGVLGLRVHVSVWRVCPVYTDGFQLFRRRCGDLFCQLGRASGC